MRRSARTLLVPVAFFLFAGLSPTFAVVGNPRLNPTKMAILPTKAAVITEENAAVRAAKVKAVVEKVLTKLGNRLDNYGEFLNRVRSRRDKLAIAGKNVTKVDAFLTVAEENLKNARTTLAAAKVTLGEVQYTGDRKALWSTVTAEVKKVKDAMVKLHTSMAQTVQQLKTSDATKPVKGAVNKGE